MAALKKLEDNAPFFIDKFKRWRVDTSGFDPRLRTRVGLNTGSAVVGNMGSRKRFDYTMLGDAVNLAARLEGLNKQFGTYFCCTEAALQAARSHSQTEIFARKLALVAVVGKKEPVTVYEPMPESLYREKEPVLAEFDRGRDLFYTGNFAEALPIFVMLRDKDPPASHYEAACRRLMAHPDEWHGWWVAATK
jgi:adenylate cyclase